MTFAAWLSHQRQGELRRPRLEEALLGGRLPRYLVHRLGGYVALRLGFATAHLAELALLFALFGEADLVHSLLARWTTALVGAAYWGYLEVLRERVRSARSKSLAAGEITRWLARVRPLALLCGLGAAGALGASTVFAARAPSAADGYAAVCLLQLGVDLLIRGYHAGAWARRRIRRPLWSLFAAPAVAVALIVALWAPLGRGAAPVALLCTTAVSRGLGLLYARRTYRLLRMPAPSWRARRRRPEPFLLGVGPAAAALAARGGTLAALAVLLRDTGAGFGGELGSLALAVQFASPFLNAAGAWPQLFYPDLVRLRAPSARLLALRLVRGLRRAAVVLGALLWLPGAAAAWALQPDVTGGDVLALLPLFPVLSLGATAHIGSFVRRTFTRNVGALLALGVGLALLHGLSGGATPNQRTMALAGVLLLALWPLRGRGVDPLAGATDGLVTARGLAARLAGRRDPVRAGRVRLTAPPATRHAVALRLARHLGPEGSVARVDDWLVWLAPPCDQRFDAAALARATLGLARDAHWLAAPDGPTAARALGIAAVGVQPTAGAPAASPATTSPAAISPAAIGPAAARPDAASPAAASPAAVSPDAASPAAVSPDAAASPAAASPAAVGPDAAASPPPVDRPGELAGDELAATRLLAARFGRELPEGSLLWSDGAPAGVPLDPSTRQALWAAACRAAAGRPPRHDLFEVACTECDGAILAVFAVPRSLPAGRRLAFRQWFRAAAPPGAAWSPPATRSPGERGRSARAGASRAHD